MTQPIPPTDDLDENERELARIVRALPGGEPPPALDARILKAAANAAAGSRRPRSRWLASAGAMWGIGGAAAAVLAFGVSWHTLFPGQRSGGPSTSPVAIDSEQRQDSTVSVEFKDREPRVFDNSPPPPAGNDEPARRNSAASRAPTAALATAPPPPTAAISDAAPQAFALDHMDEHVGARVAAAAPAAESDAAAAAEQAQDLAGAARAQSSAEGYAAKTNAMQARAETASADKAQALRLSPKNWLAHVRQLRDENRTAEARASLIAFQKRYPGLVIPSDLAPLLRE